MRVEQALRLLPNLEALMPLRGLLLSSARPDERVQWGSGGPYLTVGKREVEPGELARSMGPVLTSVAQHIAALYGASAVPCSAPHITAQPQSATLGSSGARLVQRPKRRSSIKVSKPRSSSHAATTLVLRRPTSRKNDKSDVLSLEGARRSKS